MNPVEYAPVTFRAILATAAHSPDTLRVRDIRHVVAVAFAELEPDQANRFVAWLYSTVPGDAQRREIEEVALELN